MNSLTKALGIGAFVLFGFSMAKAQDNNNSQIARQDSLYNVALASEKYFASEKDTVYALIAIDNYEKYYASNPARRNACNALVKKADLLHKIERNEEALAELNRIKTDSKCKDTYRNYIGYMERRLKRILSNNP